MLLSPSRQKIAVAVFLVIFFLLNRLWFGVRDSWIEHLVIDQATVVPAATLIHLLTPQIAVRAVGSHLSASGGGLNILNGCEGVDIVFMLLAAFIALWRDLFRSLVGIAIGVVLIFLVNQIRVLGLFYAARTDAALFDLLHTVVTPLAMMVLALGFWAYWTKLLHRPNSREGQA